MKLFSFFVVLFSFSIASADMLCVCKTPSKCGAFERIVLENQKDDKLMATLGDSEFENSEGIRYEWTGKRMNGDFQYRPLKVQMVMFSGRSPWLYLSGAVKSKSDGHLYLSVASGPASNRGRFECKRR